MTDLTSIRPERACSDRLVPFTHGLPSFSPSVRFVLFPRPTHQPSEVFP